MTQRTIAIRCRRVSSTMRCTGFTNTHGTPRAAGAYADLHGYA
jgi:hypothetical protein